jgi:DNA-directed RNA polymerase subunit RPC12/RpoP
MGLKMAKLKYEISCPRCGNLFKGSRSEDERILNFECPSCSGKFSINFDPGLPWRKAREKFEQGEDISDEFL